MYSFARDAELVCVEEEDMKIKSHPYLTYLSHGKAPQPCEEKKAFLCSMSGTLMMSGKPLSITTGLFFDYSHGSREPVAQRWLKALEVMFCDTKAKLYLDFCFGQERATEEKLLTIKVGSE